MAHRAETTDLLISGRGRDEQRLHFVLSLDTPVHNTYDRVADYTEKARAYSLVVPSCRRLMGIFNPIACWVCHRKPSKNYIKEETLRI